MFQQICFKGKAAGLMKTPGPNQHGLKSKICSKGIEIPGCKLSLFCNRNFRKTAFQSQTLLTNIQYLFYSLKFWAMKQSAILIKRRTREVVRVTHINPVMQRCLRNLLNHANFSTVMKTGKFFAAAFRSRETGNLYFNIRKISV